MAHRPLDLLLVALLLLSSFSLPAGAVSGYYVDGGKLFDPAGQRVQLRGVNWFGFETGEHVVHGLWARNWRDMVAQIDASGFNALRVPFCPATLNASSVSSANYSLNPDLQGLNSLQVFDLFLDALNEAGIYILLDHHRPDCAAISELWTTAGYSESQWIGDLNFVADRYRDLPYLIGIDLKNEPHGAATWGSGNNATDWNRAAERAAAQVLATNPNLLIFVEGIQENATCSGNTNHWWGGNLEPFKCQPLAIPAEKLVLSPHVYGPDVYNQPYFGVANFPANMPAIWDAHFGYLIDQGYAVVLGEFGGRYGHGGDPKDKIWQDALAAYLADKGVDEGFYWSWNPNSGDTGGILQDDWTSVWDDKLELLGLFWGSNQAPRAECGDGLDNDLDGFTDYPNDPDCSSAYDNDEASPPAACNDGRDNDGDGKSDYPADPGCSSLTDNDEWNAAPAACADGLDNDGDGKSDYPADPGCASGTDADETDPAPSVFACGDGKDNDGDGLIDLADPGCKNADDPGESDRQMGAGLRAADDIDTDWGGGYCRRVLLANIGTTPIDWTISFAIDGVIFNSWSANFHPNGQILTVDGLDWNNILAPGSSTEFGFCANRSQPQTLAVTVSGAGRVVSEPYGILCGDQCSRAFSSGTAITLGAVPAPGQRFTGWSDPACGQSPTCAFSLSSAKQITAGFAGADNLCGTGAPLYVQSATTVQAQAIGSLQTSGDFAIPNGAVVRYRATQSIGLMPGFSVQQGADFRAEIGAVNCAARTGR